MVSRVKFIHNISIEDLSIIIKLLQFFVTLQFSKVLNSIIEALSSGIPVITSKGGCFNEAGGPFSEYINPKDKDELRSKIDMILMNQLKKEENVLLTGLNI